MGGAVPKRGPVLRSHSHLGMCAVCIRVLGAVCAGPAQARTALRGLPGGSPGGRCGQPAGGPGRCPRCACWVIPNQTKSHTRGLHACDRVRWLGCHGEEGSTAPPCVRDGAGSEAPAGGGGSLGSWPDGAGPLRLCFVRGLLVEETFGAGARRPAPGMPGLSHTPDTRAFSPRLTLSSERLTRQQVTRTLGGSGRELGGVQAPGEVCGVRASGTPPGVTGYEGCSAGW